MAFPVYTKAIYSPMKTKISSTKTVLGCWENQCKES